MKVLKLRLDSYLHFRKGLEIDLTFPKGHSRAGQPLDKVCFLGQSGTGKTALLNLIKRSVCENSDPAEAGLDKTAFVKDAFEFYYLLNGRVHSKVSAGNFEFDHYEIGQDGARKQI